MSYYSEIKTYLYVLKLQRSAECFYKIGISWKPELRQTKIKRQNKCDKSTLIYLEGFNNVCDARFVESKLCLQYKENVLFGKEYFKQIPDFINKVALAKEALNV